MGVIPSVAFVLVDATPFSVRYLMTSSGQQGATTLPNAGGASPDLLTDAISGVNGAGPSSLVGLLGIAAATQAIARQLLCGEDGAAVVPPGGHAQTELTPRGATAGAWRVDAAIAAARPVLQVTPPAVAGAECYLTVVFKHSKRDGAGI